MRPISQRISKYCLAIVIVLVIFSPAVSATYTQEYNWTLGAGGTHNQYLNYITFMPQALYNMTWLHGELACSAPSVSSGTEEVSFSYSGTTYAYATRTWSYTPGMTYKNISPYGLTVDYYIHNTSPYSTTTTKTYTVNHLSGDNPMSTSFVCYYYSGAFSNQTYPTLTRWAQTGSPYYDTGYYETWAGDPISPGINFTATPVSGNAPLNVTFVDTSDQDNDWRRWNFGDGNIENTTASTITHTFQHSGRYTIKLETYSSTYGAYNLTKDEYIYVVNPTGLKVALDIRDAVNGNIIHNVSWGVQNTTTGVWRNYTNDEHGCVWIDTTDPGYLYPISLNQSLKVAAESPGYTPNSLTFSVPYDEYLAILYLVKSDFAVNATGKGTLAVSTVRDKDGVSMGGVSVTLSDGQMATTNNGGSALFYNVTPGLVWITGNDGYGEYETTEISAYVTEGTTTMAVLEMVLKGEKPIATYGTPDINEDDPLVDTDGDGVGDTRSSIVGNYTPGQLNQKGSSGLMEMLGLVIQLWPLALMMAFMKFMRMCSE